MEEYSNLRLVVSGCIEIIYLDRARIWREGIFLRVEYLLESNFKFSPFSYISEEDLFIWENLLRTRQSFQKLSSNLPVYKNSVTEIDPTVTILLHGKMLLSICTVFMKKHTIFTSKKAKMIILFMISNENQWLYIYIQMSKQQSSWINEDGKNIYSGKMKNYSNTVCDQIKLRKIIEIEFASKKTMEIKWLGKLNMPLIMGNFRGKKISRVHGNSIISPTKKNMWKWKTW